MVLKGITENKAKRTRPEVEQLKEKALQPDKPNKEDLKRLNVEIQKEDWLELRKLALQQEITLADLVRNVIREYLRK